MKRKAIEIIRVIWLTGTLMAVSGCISQARASAIRKVGVVAVKTVEAVTITIKRKKIISELTRPSRVTVKSHQRQYTGPPVLNRT